MKALSSTLWFRLVCFILVTWFAAPTTAWAQVCHNGTNCSQAEKDKVDGVCCPKPPLNPPGGGSTTPRTTQCTIEGQIKLENKCCWPNQKNVNNRCRGIPSCPSGYKAAGEDCVPLECTQGRVRPPKAPARCCWPGQDWDPAGGECVGIPTSCGKGFEIEGADCVSLDKDGDGVPNKSDKCPSDPEDRDGYQDGDGCVDPDNDNDGFPDAQDGCRNEAEDKDNFKDDDGCPDTDNDGDGVPDAADRCGDQAEDLDGSADTDGCPETDNDGDGVPDEADRCAAEPEDRNQFEDDDGCPDEARRQEADRAEQQRRFANARALHEEDREAAASRRIGAYVLFGLGAAGGGIMGAFLALGESNNEAIRNGEFATGADMTDAESTGQTYNDAALGAGLVGGAALGAGLIVLLVSLDPGEYQAAASRPARYMLAPSVNGVVFGGEW